MPVNAEKTGMRIASLRKSMGLTQNELGEKLNITFQAVSKWERGETLPDTSILVELAGILNTSVDDILSGGDKLVKPKGKLSVSDVREGINSLKKFGMMLGKQNILYRYAIDGMSEKMSTDVETMLSDENLTECLMLEAMIHNMSMGYYYELADVKSNFKYERWNQLFSEYAERYKAI